MTTYLDKVARFAIIWEDKERKVVSYREDFQEALASYKSTITNLVFVGDVHIVLYDTKYKTVEFECTLSARFV